MISLLLTAYLTILVAELAGDKTLYTLTTLAMRFRLFPILSAVVVAFMLKMLAAVLLGGLLARLPGGVVAAISATTFFGMAVALWLKRPGETPAQPMSPTKWSRAALISFAAIFFPEWGDAGQLAAAMLAAQHRAPVVVWVGATLAMVTKASLTLTLGFGLRRYLPQRVVRVVTLLVCMTMGTLAALGIEP